MNQTAKTKDFVICPVCEKGETRYFVTKNDYAFNRCDQCDFVFLNPMPKQDSLNEIYAREEKEEEPSYNKASSRLRRAFIKLPRFFPYVIGKNTLDLGCGGGFMAYALSFIAKSSTGVDINKNAITYAKNRFKRPHYFCSDFTALVQSEQKYDFVYSSEIIEHVSDVNLYMRVLQNLVKKGGYVYITTPDLGHEKVPVDITQWDVFCPPVHVQHFTRKTARVLFEKYGFEVQKFYTNKKPGLLFLSKKIS